MKRQDLSRTGLAGLLMGVVCLSANAQSVNHRRQTENQWRTGTYAGAALGALGLATHKDTVTAIGAGIAGYSGYRWSKDIASRHRLERARYYRHHHYAHRHYVRRRHK